MQELFWYLLKIFTFLIHKYQISEVNFCHSANGSTTNEHTTATTTTGSRACTFCRRARVCPVFGESKLYLFFGAKWIFQKTRIYQLYGISKGKIFHLKFFTSKLTLWIKYWKKPEYAKLIRYPTCLRFLELVQDKKFREAISVGKHAKEIDDQVLFFKSALISG